MDYTDLVPATYTIDNFLRPLRPGACGLGLSEALTETLVGAYRRGFCSCWLDVDECPSWQRTIARYARDRLRREARNGWSAEQVLSGAQIGAGKGQRAVHFRWAMKLDPRIYAGSQDYSNCTAWASREIAGGCLALDKIAHHEPHGYTARPGTAVIYAHRGTRSDSGMALEDAVRVLHTVGIALETNYLGIADLSSEAKDESAGVKWGGTKPPRALLDLIAPDRLEQVSAVSDEQAILDVLHAGAQILTGSTLTAGGAGDPISPAGPVGAHAQALIGYDDTQEFRDWYRQTTGQTLDDWVGIFDQSWGDWIKVSNWPEHLWGPRPEGAFVLQGKDTVRLLRRWGVGYACSRAIGFHLPALPDWGSGEYL